MNNTPAVSIKNSIATQLLKIVFTIYIILTVIVTTIHMTEDYIDTKNNIIQELHLAQEIFSFGLAQAIWDTNIKQIQSIFKGLSKFPSIVGVKLKSPELNISYAVGNIIGKNGEYIKIDSEGKRSSLTGLTNLFFYKFKIMYNDVEKSQSVGEITIYSSNEVVFSRVKVSFFFILLNSVIKICALLVLFLFVSRKYLTRPLSELTAATKKLSLDKIDDIHINVKTKEGNELKVLENAFNMMIKKLSLSKDILQKSEERYRNIFENSIEGFFQISSAGHFLDVNRAMVTMLGYDSKDELLSSVTDVLTQCYADFETHNTLLEQVLHKKKIISGVRTQFKRKDGSLFWGSESIKAVFDEKNTFLYYDGFLVDITERIEKEKAQKERKTAELATQAKSDFLAGMSHEIRTPMNAIIGLSELALKTALSIKQKDYLTNILISANSLLGIINDILDFSKIEAGKMDMEMVKFELYDVLNNLASTFYIKTAEKGIELINFVNEDVPQYLIGDPLRLRQILSNLIGNAVKFTHDGEILITISVIWQRLNKIRLCFSVSDSGIGIPKDKMSKLFKSFSQVDSSTTRKYGGTGLGLTISKRLSEMMNGKIWVESKDGGGSVFSFEAEFGIDTTINDKKFNIPKSLEDLNILIADDNAVSRLIIKKMLIALKFKATTVESGKKALEKLIDPDKKPYDLFITDWKMPDLDGIATCKKIRENQKLAQTPLILMSALDKDGKLSELIKSVDIDMFLLKPLNPSMLLNAITKIFEHEIPVKYVKKEISQININIDAIRGARILLVDDNEINRQVATELLKSINIFVDTATNGKEAVLATSKGNYDAVLMDIQMPEMDGYEATIKIRELNINAPVISDTSTILEDTVSQDFKFETNNPVQIRIPIIAMTANALTGDREKCIAAGMDDYITKPIDIDKMFYTLLKWITWIKPGERKIPEAKQDKDNIIVSEEIINQNKIVNQENITATKDKTKLENIAGLDISAGLKRVVGNKKLYKELLNHFLNSNKNIVEQINFKLNDADFNSAAKMVHTLKGVSANIGATEVFAITKELEVVIKQGKIEACKKLLDNLDIEMGIISDSIEHFTSEQQATLENKKIITQKKDAPVDIQLVTSVINELTGLLKRNNSEAILHFEKLKDLIGYNYKEAFTQMEDDINDMEFEQALKILINISKKLSI